MNRRECDEEKADLQEQIDGLRAAILDIDAHASPLGEDDDGFVTVGYAVSVGAMHRALGLVGHTAAPAATREPSEAELKAAEAEVAEMSEHGHFPASNAEIARRVLVAAYAVHPA